MLFKYHVIVKGVVGGQILLLFGSEGGGGGYKVVKNMIT